MPRFVRHNPLKISFQAFEERSLQSAIGYLTIKPDGTGAEKSNHTNSWWARAQYNSSMNALWTSGRISTGLFGLDLALGGGAPADSLVELYGPQESGKTSLAFSLAVQAQSAGRTVAWIDADHTFDPAYARRCGLDLPGLILVQPGWLEAGLDMTEALAASGSIGLAVLDGLDAQPGYNEVFSFARRADPPDWQSTPQFSPWLRRIGDCLRRWQTALVIIHGGLEQPRQSRPVSRAYHELADNLGRLALSLQATLRLKMAPQARLRQGRQAVGQRVRAEIMKYSLKPCLPAAEFDIMYSQGVLRSSEVLDLGVRLGVIHHQGSGYVFEQVTLGIERRQALRRLEQDALLRETIEQTLNQALRNGS